MDELILIKKAQNGNKSALNTLLTNNYPLIKGYVIKMTSNPSIAEDIIQDTMLKAVLNIKKFQAKAKFSTWLITIATNIYRDYLRKHKTTELIEETQQSSYSSPEDATIAKLEYKEIVNIIMKLPYEKRTVFILKHYYGYKYDEISEIVNCPIGTVRSRLHNSIKFIMNELEKGGILIDQ